MDFHYDRKLFVLKNADGTVRKQFFDPRVTHALTLAVDIFGNVEESVAVAYGRRLGLGDLAVLLNQQTGLALEERDLLQQIKPQVTYTNNAYTNPVLAPDAYRAPLPCESRTFELLKVTPAATLPDITNLFRFEELQEKVAAASDGLHDIRYDDLEATAATDAVPYRRVIEHARTLYRSDNLQGLLPIKQLEPKALPGESYKLAFTPRLLTNVYQRERAGLPLENLLPDRDRGSVLGGRNADQGGYVDLDGNGHWWIPSGRIFFHPDTAAAAAMELTEAINSFFLPRRVEDPFQKNSTVAYDANKLLPVTTTDARENTVTAKNDYRVLQPMRLTDPNGNSTEAAFDALGLVAGTAILGKAGELGDSLQGFEPDLTGTQIDAFFNAADPHTLAPGLLKNATTRIIYDVDRFRASAQANPNDPAKWQPAFAATLARETHVADLGSVQPLRIQLGFSYSDGFGREIQKIVQAEPGPVEGTGENVNPRWVSSGWTIFNNKGKPVRQYEPFFTATHRFVFGNKVGVSPVLFYDPVDRVIATLHPNHTYDKVVFDPWLQTTWDVNDTVLLDPRTDPDIQGFVSEYFKSEPGTWKTWHALRHRRNLRCDRRTADRGTTGSSKDGRPCRDTGSGLVRRSWPFRPHHRAQPVPAQQTKRRFPRSFTRRASSSTSKAISGKSRTPWGGSSCGTTTTCWATASIRPAWKRAGAGRWAT